MIAQCFSKTFLPLISVPKCGRVRHDHSDGVPRPMHSSFVEMSSCDLLPDRAIHVLVIAIHHHECGSELRNPLADDFDTRLNVRRLVL